MTEKTKLITIIIIILILAVAFLVFNWLRKEMPFLNRPEQLEQAEVVGKRHVDIRDSDGGSGSTDYIVAFKFPDGSLKELRVGGSGEFGGAGKKRDDSFPNKPEASNNA